MAYRTPTFNLTCRIITAGRNGPFPLAGGNVVQCQLRLMKTGLVAATGGGGSVSVLLLVPSLTDIRPAHFGSVSDAVEVPNGSGCYYAVSAVFDQAKGFPNESRVAALAPLWNTNGAFVFPIP